MSRRAALTLLVVLVAGIAAAAVFIYYRSHRGEIFTSGEKPTPLPVSTVPGGPTPLPDYFESPGLVSRRAAPLRLYVAVASEIPLQKRVSGNTQAPGEILASVPILVVLENDTYKKVNFDSELAPAGEDLFTLAITPVDPGAQEIFTYTEPRAELSEWQPAERKTFTVSWPTSGVAPGTYLVSVKPVFGKQETLRIRTTLR